MKNFTKVILGTVLGIAVFASTTNAAMTWSRSLKLGSRGADVKDLQVFLNMCADTKVSNSGAGSSGMETTYFGPATKAAVIKWQAARGVSPQSGLFGPLSRAKAADLQMSSNVCGGGVVVNPPVNQTGPVMASLSATTPAAGVLVSGQATADLAHFTFNGTGTVTNITLQRVGVSADATLSNVYLFDGATRLTDAVTVSNNGVVTFNSASGLFMVNGMKTISVKSDIVLGAAGQTVGVRLNSFATSAGVVSANITANVHSIASATLAGISAGTVTPSGATINPGSNVTLWQSTLNISQRDVMMKRFAIRQVGSASANSFANFKLFVNGVQVSTAAGVDSLGYVTFDMMANPVTLVSGSRVVRVDADVLSGASRTVNFSVRQAADVDFVDSSYGVNITPTSTPWAGSASTIGGASGGSVTVEKDTSSPTQPVSVGANDVKLGTFKVTAYGEAVKLETIKAGFATSDGSIASLRNGKIMIGGVQYGSSSTLILAGTSFTTNYVVMPGTSVMIDVYADMFDNDGTNNVSSGDTFTAKLITGVSNASKQDSLGYINVPGGDVSANTITASSASVTLAKASTYANQTVAVPQTSGYMIGKWNLTGSSVEDVLLSTLSFDVDEVTNTTFSEADLTNLTVLVKDASGNTVANPSPLGTVAATSNNFSINYSLAKNASATVELYATIGSTITATHSLKTDLTITGTASVSGIAITADADNDGATNGGVDGQTIIASAGSLTVTKDATSADARIIADNQTIDVATFNFEALYSGYNVTDLTFTIADASAVSNVMLYDGATLVASKAGSATVTFNGLNWNVQAGANKDLTVKLQLGTVGVGAGTSGASLLTTLTDVTATSTATGVSAAATESDPASNATYVYSAIPTVTNVALPTTVLSTGTVTASKFTIGTNGTGTIAWDKLIFTITRAMSGTDTLASPTLWDADTNTQIAGTATFTGSIEVDGDVAGGLTFVATNEQQISGSKTYVLKMVTAGTLVTGDNLNVSIAQPDSYAAPAAYATVAAANGGQATFVWSDVSAAGHSVSTTDWSNGYLVKNLPTDTQGLVR
jgi:hypothetical protein